jgi:hypothetical protein
MLSYRNFVTVTALLLAVGCKSKDQYAGPQDRVHVDVPFVNVRVGEHGGAKVDAPFTHVETPRYQQQYQPQAQYQQAPVQYQQAVPVNSAQPTYVAPGTYAPAQPVNP